MSIAWQEDVNDDNNKAEEGGEEKSKAVNQVKHNNININVVIPVQEDSLKTIKRGMKL
jgi:hypothetical protein